MTTIPEKKNSRRPSVARKAKVLNLPITVLSLKERRFVSAYLTRAGGNGAKAATLAGYAKGSAKVIACRLLQLERIQTALADKRKQLGERPDIAFERILAELSAVAFSDVRNLFEDGQLKEIESLDDATARAVSSVEVTTKRSKSGTSSELTKVKQWDKLRALELIAKLRGMFPADRVDVNVSAAPLFVFPAGVMFGVSPQGQLEAPSEAIEAQRLDSEENKHDL